MTARLLFITLACVVIGSSFADDRTRTFSDFDEDEDMIPVKIRTIGSLKKYLPVNKKNLVFVNNRKVKKPVDIEQMGVNTGSLSEVNLDEDSITVTDKAGMHDEDLDADEANTESAILQPRRGGGRGGGGRMGGGRMGGRGGGRRFGSGRRRFRGSSFIDNVDEVDPVDEEDF